MIESVSVQMAPGRMSWNSSLQCALAPKTQNWWYYVSTASSQVGDTNVLLWQWNVFFYVYRMFDVSNLYESLKLCEMT